MNKLRRIISVIMVALIMVCQCTVSFAAETPYSKVVKFYLDQNSVGSADEVMAVMSLNLDPVSEGMDIYDITNQDFSSMYASTLAKEIIALTLLGYDARDIDGTDLVAMLESYITPSGSIDKSGGSADANYQVYCLMALEVVGSRADLDSCYEHLMSTQLDSGAFGFGSYPSPDVTGWVLDLYGISDKSKTKIKSAAKAMSYLNSLYDHTADGWDEGYGISSNTQACVLMGLLGYEHTFTTANYDKAYDTLVSFQGTDGWFGWNNNTSYNKMSTIQSAEALGYWKYGSVLKKAKDLYAASFVHGDDDKPEAESTPSDATPSSPTSIENHINVSVPPTTVNVTTQKDKIDYYPDVEVNPTIQVKQPDIAFNPQITLTPNISIPAIHVPAAQVNLSPVIELPEEYAKLIADAAAGDNSPNIDLTVSPQITVENNAQDYTPYIKYALILLTILVGVEACKLVLSVGGKKN